MVYYFVFTTSLFCIWISELFSNKSKYLFGKCLFVILAIFTLALMAGMRSYEVGADTFNYNTYFYYVENANGIVNYCNQLYQTFGIEYGYAILNYVIYSLVPSAHFFYFICQILILTNVYLAINMVRAKVNVGIAWATYVFLFYTLSFNALRQSIALSFILLSITYMFTGKSVKSFVMILFATFFHISSIIGGLIFGLGLVLLKVRRKGIKASLLFIYMIFILILPTAAKFLNNSGFFSDKYSNYFTEYTQYSLVSTIGMRLPMIILILISLMLLKSKLPSKIVYVYLITISEFCLLPLQGISTAVGRIILYFGISKVISYPVVLNYLKLNNKIIRGIAYAGLVIFLAGIFYGQVIMNNNGLVYPYTVSTDIF